MVLARFVDVGFMAGCFASLGKMNWVEAGVTRKHRGAERRCMIMHAGPYAEPAYYVP
jgi:hypothetical protein